jgi:ribosomal protein S18 acetylase RimI-like enzyme
VSVTVRPARPRDIGAMADVTVSAWREGFAGVVPPAFAPDRVQAAENLARRVRDDPGSAAVGELNGLVRGYTVFGPSRDTDTGEPTGEIYALHVDPHSWRRGVGRAMVRFALERLRERGFVVATLWTLRDTPRSHAFYEALGFELDGATHRRQMTGGAPEVRYRIALR